MSALSYHFCLSPGDLTHKLSALRKNMTTHEVLLPYYHTSTQIHCLSVTSTLTDQKSGRKFQSIGIFLGDPVRSCYCLL